MLLTNKNQKASLFIRIFFIVAAVVMPYHLHASDACGSATDYSFTMSPFHPLQVQTMTVPKEATILYYIQTTTGGTLTITSSNANNKIHLSGSETTCPSGSSTGGTSLTYSSTSAFDVNVAVYATNAETHILTITFVPSVTVVNNADDLCYETPIYTGNCSVGNAICSGGTQCYVTYPLLNRGDATVSNVEIIYDQTGVGSGIFFDCSVAPSGTCDKDSSFQFGSLYDFSVSTDFYLDNDIPVDDNSSSISTTLANTGDCMDPALIYATYIKDGVYYVGKLQACTGGGGGEETPPSTVDIVDPDEYQYYDSRQVLKTKVSGNPNAQYTVVYLDPATMTPTNYNNSGDFNFLPPLEVLLYRSDSTCTDELPLATPVEGSPVGEPVFAEIENGTDHAETNTFTVAYVANKDTRIIAKYADWGVLLEGLESANSCFLNSNMSANFNGLPQCLNNLGSTSGISQEFIDKYPNIESVCLNPALTTDEQPCGSSAYDNSGSKGFIQPQKYNHAYGCLACILDAAADVTACSRDNFAIRPESYSLDLNDSALLKIAGKPYGLDANATYVGGGSTPTPGYTTILDNINDKNATIVFSPKPSATNCPDTSDHNFTISFDEGSGAQAIVYTNVGDVDITLADENWTGVDQNKSTLECLPGSDRTSPEPVGCLVTAAISERFIPDRFEVAATLQDSDELHGFTYLYDMNRWNANSLTDDYNLSTARLTVDINATGYDGNVTSNYTDKCYANDTNVTLSIYSTTIEPAGALTQFLYFNPLDENTSIDNSGEGSEPLPSNVIDELPIENLTTSFEGDGTTHIEYNLNFDRKVNQPVDPFRLALKKVEVEDNETAPYTVYGYDDSSDTATFLYGRVHAPRYRVDCNVTGMNEPCTSGGLAMYFEFYSKDSNLSLRQSLAPDVNRSKDAIYWFRNGMHELTDGNITSVTQRFVSPVEVSVPTAATWDNTNHTELWKFQYTGKDGYPYKAAMGIDSNHWLLYNRYDANATTNTFELEFNAGPGTKAGQDNLGSTDNDGDANTNRRIRW
jgi:hypothetical protein